MPYSTAEWTLLASPKKLAIGDARNGCLVIANPMLRGWELSLDQPYSAIALNGEVCRYNGVPSCNLRIDVQGAAVESTDRLSHDLRFADEMTVRELFSQIDRQLRQREG